MTSIGVALTRDQLTARALDSTGTVHRWPLPETASADVWNDALRGAMRALRVAVPSARTLHVSLLPPLAEVRIVSLPTAAPDRVLTAVERDAAKYFTVGHEPQFAYVELADGARGGAFAPHLVAAAPSRDITAILAAAASAGFTVESLAPAQLAWAAADRTHSNGTRHAVQAHTANRVDILDVQRGVILGLRRHRAAAQDAAVQLIARNADEASALAAQYANVGRTRSLWPPTIRAERIRATQRAAVRWCALALGLVLMAAILSFVGDARRLSSVRAARASLRPQLESALVLRDSLTQMTTRLAALRALGQSPSWTAAMVAVGDALPADASIIQLRASGDTIYLNGEADHAAATLTALAQSPALRGVRLDAPIQQAIENGEVVGERFSITARIAPVPVRGALTRPSP